MARERTVERVIEKTLKEYVSLVRSYANFILYGFVHYFFSGLGQTFLISIFVPFFIADLAIDNLRFTSLYSLATLASAFTLPILGRVLDRVKIRFFSMGIGIGIIVFAVLASQVQTPWMLLVALFGLRLCGQGLMPLTSTTGIARYFDQNRGKALAISGFGISFSEAIFSLGLAILIGDAFNIPWRYLWMGLAVSVLLIYFPSIFLLVKIDSPFQTGISGETASPQKPVKSRSQKEVLRDLNFYFILLPCLFFPFFFTGMVINHNLLALHKGWTMSLLATGLSAFGITGFIMKVVGGAFVDRFTATRVFPFALIPYIPALICLMFFKHPAAAFVYLILGGVSASLISLSASALWAEIYGTEHFGAIRSLTSTFMVFISALAPIIFSYGLATEESMIRTFFITLVSLFVLSGMAFYGTGKELRKKES